MASIQELTASARTNGLPAWIVVKEELARHAVVAFAGEPRAILQGGGALHFAYGSPRLSADVDFVGVDVSAALTECGPALAAQVQAALDLPVIWSMTCAGRLSRGKITVQIDTARRLVLPIEAYDIRAHQVRIQPPCGKVEEPTEIMADKVVASADRLARRGALKTRDLYDLWFLVQQLRVAPPPQSLVVEKLADYGHPARGADLAAAVLAVSVEEMASSLDGVLPLADLARTDAGEILACAAQLLDAYRDVL